MKKEKKSLGKDAEKISEKREIGLFSLLAFLAGAFSMISGIITIKAGQIFIGLLFILLSFFLFIPKKYFKITSSLRGTLFVLFYFILLVVSGLNSPQPEQQYEYYSLGDSFNVTSNKATFSIIIYNTSISKTLKINENELTSSGVYLSVNGEIMNLEKFPAEFTLKSELNDKEDNIYTLVAINMGIGSFQPNIKRKFSHFFEVPENISDLNFLIKDKSKIIKVVSLDE